MTGRGAAWALDRLTLVGPVEPVALGAASAAAVIAALVAAAEAKSAGVNIRPESMGMRMVEKKSTPPANHSALTFDFGGALSRCTSYYELFPLNRATSVFVALCIRP